MKKLLIGISFILLLTACGDNDKSEEYIQWGDNVNTIDIDKLEENGISYEIENDIIYIPSNEFDKAILCCS
ncbi:hypothetical protein SAMN05421734_104202 [Pelagirhabdus alkalitolerans]|uniref:Lipoprotein n=1 Tax=Pelagirhabdus alkalitolerans TaxID=1612202 RepID=A0A1G6J1T0_9BACI|nr:hypothetical protein [Pelagirhabdus alkalitolerans]SDC12701.1 hypothetical protein SAMN05421734_104202 [Pelagirhabdus alkalitolerans]